ncbi:MAG: PepSY domain-containing protein [Acidovorax sp.]|uniref:PepSY domain-containing protein n=1 Tax=Acidovorax sp. TaxID=1872122 RepID=UPI00262B2D2E|nr:PepSY domain-containing protein [Acidovorax sp.]MDH4463372.1 PepSY domain-containing protein [Acidovorax sp.]
METLYTVRHGAMLLWLGLAVPTAWASNDCDAPLSRWQTREAVREMAVAQGWQIQRLKIDDGCYEIRGKDAEGRGFKAKLDPETLKVLKMKPAERSHSRDRDGEGTARPARPLVPHNAAPAASSSPQTSTP